MRTRGWLLAGLMTLALALNATAAIWSGAGGDANWDTPNNWGGTLPADNEAITFGNFTPAASTFSVSNNHAGLLIGTLNFSGTTAYNLGGLAITSTMQSVATNSSSVKQTVSADFYSGWSTNARSINGGAAGLEFAKYINTSENNWEHNVSGNVTFANFYIADTFTSRGNYNLSFNGNGTATIGNLYANTQGVKKDVGISLYNGQKMIITGTVDSTINKDFFISYGRLVLAASADASAFTTINIAGANSTLINNSTLRLDKLTWNSGTLGGTGSILASRGGLATANNASYHIAPGDIDSVGKLSFVSGGVNWDNGASTITYDWNFSDLTGAAGVGYDQIFVDGGKLDLGGNTLYVLNLVGLGGASISDFASYGAGTWDLLSASGGITNFNLANWTVSGGLPNDVTLSLSGDGKSLQLQLIPEPSTWALILSGAALLLTLRRRRCAYVFGRYVMKNYKWLLAGLMILALGATAQAKTTTWTGGAGDFLWSSTVTNWDVTWEPNDIARFGNVSPGNLVTINSDLNSDTSFNKVWSIEFLAGTTRYNLTGTSFRFTASSVSWPIVANNSSVKQTISADVYVKTDNDGADKHFTGGAAGLEFAGKFVNANNGNWNYYFNSGTTFINQFYLTNDANANGSTNPQLSLSGNGTVVMNEIYESTNSGNTKQFGLGLNGTQKLMLTGTSYVKGVVRLFTDNTALILQGNADINAALGVYSSANNGAIINNSSVTLTNLEWQTGTIGGTGSILASRGVLWKQDVTSYRIAPGDINSVGKLSFTGGDLKWENGASTVTYDWNFSDLAAAAGVGYDQIFVDGGKLDLGTSTTYVLNLVGLDGASLGDFANYSAGAWDLLSASGGITNFDLAKWTVSGGLPSGVTLSLSGDSTKLQLQLIPEPSTVALLSLSGLALLALARRRCRSV